MSVGVLSMNPLDFLTEGPLIVAGQKKKKKKKRKTEKKMILSRI